MQRFLLLRVGAAAAIEVAGGTASVEATAEAEAGAEEEMMGKVAVAMAVVVWEEDLDWELAEAT